MPLKKINPDRYQIFHGVTNHELEEVAQDSNCKFLQFAEPLSDTEIKLLETVVFSKRSDITLRVFGFYGHSCDLTFLQQIPSAKNISLDCLQNATGVEVLTKFSTLSKLIVGIYNLDNFNFLKDVSSNITELSITKTSSKKPSIDVIKRFSGLRYLYLEGQDKGIEVIQELKSLEKIVLRSVTTNDLNYLEGLEKLWSVDIKLGGIKRLDALSKLQNLKYLELWQIRGLSNLSFISGIHSLQNLFIQSLKQIASIPPLNNLKNLRRICLENLKGLTDLTALEYCDSLQDFIYVLAENQQPEDLLPILRNPNVKNVFCRFGSNKKNEHFDRLANDYNKKQYANTAFKYD